jgi:tetratricopeptide (TPR) repeat protein
MMAPLHAQDSPMSTASSQVSTIVNAARRLKASTTQSPPFLQAGSECSPTASNALPDKSAWSLGGFSLGAAAAIKSGAGPSSRTAAKTADEFHSRAYALRKRGNFQAAIEEYVVCWRALAREWCDGWWVMVVLTLCAHVLACSGTWPFALQKLVQQRLLLDEDGTVSDVIPFGLACHAAIRYDEAAECFTGALAVAPLSALALCNRGTCRLKAGEMEAALRDFDAALGVDPSNVDCLMARGLVNRKLGCMAEAMYDFSRVIELQPSNSKAYVNRAMMYEDINDVNAAMMDCNRALQIDPRGAKSHFCLGMCLERRGDHEAALDALSKAIDLEKNPAYFNARAMLRDKLGLFDDCIDDLNKAIALEPANDALLHNRGEDR